MTTHPLINRELSWLEFNQRILDQVRDPGLPLLERIRFLSIITSNLDEFFMVRVGGLHMLMDRGITKPDPSGLAPAAQLSHISRRVHEMVKQQYRCYLDELEPLMDKEGIRRLRSNQLTPPQNQHAARVFENDLFPILTPIGVASPAEMPLLPNRALHLCVRLKPAPAEDPARPRFAVVLIGKKLSRFIPMPSEGGYHFMLVEDVVSMFAHRFFAGETIMECVPLRITRNADMSVREDLAADLLSQMEEVLDERKRSDCVHLEIDSRVTKTTVSFLQKALEISDEMIFPVAGPLDFSSFSALSDVRGFEKLRFEPWPPQPCLESEPGSRIFDAIAGGKSILLYHPFDSFEPVLRLIDQSADDPDVVALKMILYRTSRTSPIVAALIRAAEKGKYVTAIVELKARFDEARNIERAKSLEDAGVQVIYGVKTYKTHAKICMVIRRESNGLQRYVHFGTGNYNETTAQLYTDVSYLTSNEDLVADASSFLNMITGYSQPQKFRKIDAAPISLREKIIELIEGEAERKHQGQQAWIRAKMNSLADTAVINALYAASQAGVCIQLNIRGICCLRPGIPGLSENISVVSIIDRFLEHSRIMSVCNDGEEKVFISTADWMPRNLDRRVELLVPVEEPSARERLLHILDVCLRETINGWKLLPDGRYERLRPTSKKRAVRSQEVLYRDACRNVEEEKQLRRTVFEPHRPPSPTPS